MQLFFVSCHELHGQSGSVPVTLLVWVPGGAVLSAPRCLAWLPSGEESDRERFEKPLLAAGIYSPATGQGLPPAVGLVVLPL